MRFWIDEPAMDGCLGDESREGWCRCPQTATSVAIAAHEAEVVGSVLDRIDALHAKSTTRVYTERECQDGICDDHRDDISGSRYCPSYLLDVCRECSHYCCDDGDRDEPFPCPTRRLTAEIRGEMSHG